MEPAETPRRRADRSNAEARLAVSSVVGQFPAWREDLARFTAMVARGSAHSDRPAIAGRCSEIAGEIQLARVALIDALLEAPRRVAGHGRVADVEKALDDVERTLTAVRVRLHN